MIAVRESGIAGRGVFAERDIYPGTVVEHCPLLLMDKDDVGWADHHVVKFSNKKSGFPCGKSVFLNHSKEPNVRFELLPGKQVHTIAIRKIKKGDELLLDYGPNPEYWGIHES